MAGSGPNLPARWRLAVIGLVILAAFAALASRLHRVQVVESRTFADRAVRQSVRRVLLPATRGRIFDRSGVCLADIRPNYCLAFYIEELRRPGPWSHTIDAVDEEIDRLARVIGRPRETTRDDIATHVRKRLPMPFLAWEGIDYRSLARFAEHVEPSFPGVDIHVQSERVYPHGSLAAHLLGYVGRDKPAITNFAPHFYVPDLRGRAGIEATCDDILAGQPGSTLLRVDAAGYKHDVWETRPPLAGRDVTLTIDASLQATGERLLAGRRGAIVAVDPRNGEVLALVSMPGFDLNAMSPAPSAAYWKKLNSDPDTPLLNRAIGGVYPPGSTFKPCVALAAATCGISPGLAYDCTGSFTLGAARLHCWNRSGHGEISLRKAIEQSCNPYFCHLGILAGWPAVYDAAAALGFGERTGIPLPGERAGLLPDDAWKRKARRDAWRSGDTANASVGQGALLATPLQLAVYAGVLANGGTLRPPRLLLGPPDAVDNPLPVRSLSWPGETMETVRNGMYDVVNAPYGTGRLAKVPGVAVAGKTGTAEYGPRANRRKHAWMIAFAPFEAPEIALAVLVEDGDSGGKTAAPIVRAMIAAHFGIEIEAPSENGNEARSGEASGPAPAAAPARSGRAFPRPLREGRAS
jgi:penicillin-binding protein 2